MATEETVTKRAIKHYLGIMGWWCFHVLQGLGSYKGTPDLIAMKDGIVLFLEVKAQKGKQSEHQKAFEDRVIQFGGRTAYYMLVRSTQELETKIKWLSVAR